MNLLYLPTQIRFPIGGERLTCRGSNSQLPRANRTHYFPMETNVKQMISSQFSSRFELGSITKCLMTSPKGNIEGFVSGNIEGLGETKLAVPHRASH